MTTKTFTLPSDQDNHTSEPPIMTAQTDASADIISPTLVSIKNMSF